MCIHPPLLIVPNNKKNTIPPVWAAFCLNPQCWWSQDTSKPVLLLFFFLERFRLLVTNDWAAGRKRIERWISVLLVLVFSRGLTIEHNQTYPLLTPNNWMIGYVALWVIAPHLYIMIYTNCTIQEVIMAFGRQWSTLFPVFSQTTTHRLINDKTNHWSQPHLSNSTVPVWSLTSSTQSEDNPDHITSASNMETLHNLFFSAWRVTWSTCIQSV